MIFVYLIKTKGQKILDCAKCVTLKEDAEVSVLKRLADSGMEDKVGCGCG